ncbi:hypothetical protein FB451DRAFT_1054543 [Mycena latifolia]|nr:hypothetical protein FB451DRAFT_1054543 [Mycena latifolia]
MSSPIRRIPTEILTHIFMLSKPSIMDAREMDWYKALQGSPWVLGHISRHWRAVALASPTLWTSIIIRNTGTSEDLEPCSIPMLETQLVRSGNSPLDIIFDYERFDADTYVAEEALKALEKCCSRWRSLYITAEQLLRLHRIRGRLPLLEKVSVW